MSLVPVLPNSSAIPGALTQFTAMMEATLPAETTIWVGSTLPAYSAPLTLEISEVTGTQVPATIGTSYLREETFQIICTLVAYQGGVPDFVAMTNTVMSNFDLISSAIGNNPTLNNAVRFAEVGNFDLQMVTDNNGQGVASLDFKVSCQQRVLSLS